MTFKDTYHKYKRMILLITVLLIIFIYFISKSLDKRDIKKNIITEPTIKVEYEGLTIGESSRDEVIQKIGNPINEILNEGSTTIEYETLNPNFNDQFKLINNKLEYIKEIITLEDSIRMKDLVNKYGNADLILYGPGSGIGIFLYAIPQRGIAYIGHEKSGYLTEIWYFTPTSNDDFIEKYGNGYNTEKEDFQ